MICTVCPTRPICNGLCPGMEAQLREPSPRERPLESPRDWYGDYRTGMHLRAHAEEIREYLQARTEWDRLVCVLHIAGFSVRYISEALRCNRRRVAKVVCRYAGLFEGEKGEGLQGEP